MVIKQIVDFTSIDLVHGDCHGEVALVVLPVVDSALEQVLHRQVLQALHRVGLARAGLPIGKNGDSPRVEDQVEDGLHTEAVQFLVAFVLAERVVKFEILIVDELCDAVHLVLAIVHDYFGVRG